MGKPLSGRTILLGITGSIAAYKGVEVARRLIALGADVHATLTRAGAQFITPLTLRTLSHHPVTVDMFEDPQEWEVKHVSLAQRTSAVVVAPASADAIARLALGIADEFLYTVALATRSPLIIAPAMNTSMYEHPATQEHLQTLRARGAHIVEPEVGELASGAVGRGRLAAPEVIAAAVVAAVTAGNLQGVRVLVTAGPTREPLDPVRFISNRSSGKMGYAVAAAAATRGAQVTLVSGPTSLPDPEHCVIVRVNTAEEMREAVAGYFDDSDVLIAAAAVADYMPAQVQAGKLKRSKGPITVQLGPTPDIVAECGQRKRPSQILVGFAAETEDLLARAKEKLKSKRLNMIVANDVSLSDIGFDSDENAGVLLLDNGEQVNLPKMGKSAFAERILDAIVAARGPKQGPPRSR
jgi:phosphopantothenoylcysteine decarboxylase/phosphopantothenate--cysteine ligase